MVSRDPLVRSLETAPQTARSYTLLIDELYADRPKVLESIRRARQERKLSYRQIAKVLSTDGAMVSAGAVQNWLGKQGIA